MTKTLTLEVPEQVYEAVPRPAVRGADPDQDHSWQRASGRRRGSDCCASPALSVAATLAPPTTTALTPVSPGSTPVLAREQPDASGHLWAVVLLRPGPQLCNPLRGRRGFRVCSLTREALRFPFAAVLNPFGVGTKRKTLERRGHHPEGVTHRSPGQGTSPWVLSRAPSRQPCKGCTRMTPRKQALPA